MERHLLQEPALGGRRTYIYLRDCVLCSRPTIWDRVGPTTQDLSCAISLLAAPGAWRAGSRQRAGGAERGQGSWRKKGQGCTQQSGQQAGQSRCPKGGRPWTKLFPCLSPLTPAPPRPTCPALHALPRPAHSHVSVSSLCPSMETTLIQTQTSTQPQRERQRGTHRGAT